MGVNNARTKIKASLLRTGMLTLLAAITAFMVLVVVLHNRNTWWTYNLQSEGVARQTIEKYLASVQTGRRFSAAQPHGECSPAARSSTSRRDPGSQAARARRRTRSQRPASCG